MSIYLAIASLFPTNLTLYFEIVILYLATLTFQLAIVSVIINICERNSHNYLFKILIQWQKQAIIPLSAL